MSCILTGSPQPRLRCGRPRHDQWASAATDSLRFDGMTDRYASFRQDTDREVPGEERRPARSGRAPPVTTAPPSSPAPRTGRTGRLPDPVTASLDAVGVASTHPAPRASSAGPRLRRHRHRDPRGLVALYDFFMPLIAPGPLGPLVVLGPRRRQPSGTARVAQRALEGFTRSLGKEVGRGPTVQLVYVAPGAEDAPDLHARVLCPPSLRMSRAKWCASARPAQPTWTATRTAARRQGRARHRREPAASARRSPACSRATARRSSASTSRGPRASCRVTASSAATTCRSTSPTPTPRADRRAVTEHLGGVDVVVHNAGITRDKKLANMHEGPLESVIDVNLTAPERITRALLDQGRSDNGRSSASPRSRASPATRPDQLRGVEGGHHRPRPRARRELPRASRSTPSRPASSRRR